MCLLIGALLRRARPTRPQARRHPSSAGDASAPERGSRSSSAIKQGWRRPRRTRRWARTPERRTPLDPVREGKRVVGRRADEGDARQRRVLARCDRVAGSPWLVSQGRSSRAGPPGAGRLVVCLDHEARRSRNLFVRCGCWSLPLSPLCRRSCGYLRPRPRICRESVTVHLLDPWSSDGNPAPAPAPSTSETIAGDRKAPFFAEKHESSWFSSSSRPPAADLAFGGFEGDGESESASASSSTEHAATGSTGPSRYGPGGGASAGGTCCDSHRLLGEALVLYLKSLSMAKEAIIWGNQALESLSVPPPPRHSASSVVGTPEAVGMPSTSVPLSPPLSSHAKHLPTDSPVRRISGVGTAVDELTRGYQQQFRSAIRGPGGLPGPGASSRASAARVDPDDVGSSRNGAGGTGSAGSGGGSGKASSSSEAQVAAWGSSLVGWLTGQFSTILRRAERCRLELRGPSADETKTTRAAAAAAAATTTNSVGSTGTGGDCSSRGSFVTADSPSSSPGDPSRVVGAEEGAGPASASSSAAGAEAAAAAAAAAGSSGMAGKRTGHDRGGRWVTRRRVGFADLQGGDRLRWPSRDGVNYGTR